MNQLRERRQDRRQSCQERAIITWDSDGIAWQTRGRVLNLSSTGVAVECFDRLPDRSIVAVAVPQAGRHGLATVRYSERRGLKVVAGLEFLARPRPD